MSRAENVRFRHSPAILVAAIVAFIGAIPLASAAWFLTPVLLIPTAVAVWAWRGGTEAGPDGVRVRALLGERRIDWSEIVELAPDERSRVVARLTNGNAIRLPAVSAADLPRLVAASGQPVVRQ
ncbi:MAG TPA: PH domain-containing protein [Micromonosporaceae bacterium]